MVLNPEQQQRKVRSRSRQLAAVKTLLYAVLVTTILNLCLLPDLQTEQHEPTGIGCHGNCWYQRPAWQPEAVLPTAPGLSLPPARYARFIPPAADTMTGRDQHGSPLPSRSPPMPQ